MPKNEVSAPSGPEISGLLRDRGACRVPSEEKLDKAAPKDLAHSPGYARSGAGGGTVMVAAPAPGHDRHQRRKCLRTNRPCWRAAMTSCGGTNCEAAASDLPSVWKAAT